jgi:hypothetical protein
MFRKIVVPSSSRPDNVRTAPLLDPEVDVIVPIPLFFEKMLERV